MVENSLNRSSNSTLAVLCKQFIQEKNQYHSDDNEKVARISHFQDEMRRESLNMTDSAIPNRLIYKCGEDLQNKRKKYLVCSSIPVDDVQANVNGNNNFCEYFFCAVCIIFGKTECNKNASSKKNVCALRSTGLPMLSYSSTSTKLSKHEKTKYHMNAYDDYMKTIDALQISRSLENTNISSVNIIHPHPYVPVKLNTATTYTTTTTTTMSTTTTATTSVLPVSSISSALRGDDIDGNMNVGTCNNSIDCALQCNTPFIPDDCDRADDDLFVNNDTTNSPIDANRLIVFDVIYCLLLLLSFGE
jgi:hypothetical protein